MNPTNVTTVALGDLPIGTYGFSPDATPSANQKIWLVTDVPADTVASHTVSRPFMTSFVRPQTFKKVQKGGQNGVTITSVPKNSFKLKTIKNAVISGNYVDRDELVIIATEFAVPASAEVSRLMEIEAAIAVHIAFLTSQRESILDAIVTGLI